MASAPARTLSVVIPAYNERGNLEAAVRSNLAAAEGLDAFELLLVDDGSDDGTAELVDELAAGWPSVRAFHHTENQGFAAAYRTGLAHARYDYVTFMPGDNEVALESIRAIYGAIGERDLVVPYHRTPEQRPLFRRVLTWVSTAEINLLFGWRLRYFQGPTVYPTALARALPVTCAGFFFVTEMLIRARSAGYSYVEVGLRHQERTYGRSKALALRKLVDAELTILRLWWTVRVRNSNPVPPAPRARATSLAGRFD